MWYTREEEKEKIRDYTHIIMAANSPSSSINKIVKWIELSEKYDALSNSRGDSYINELALLCSDGRSDAPSFPFLTSSNKEAKKQILKVLCVYLQIPMDSSSSSSDDSTTLLDLDAFWKKHVRILKPITKKQMWNAIRLNMLVRRHFFNPLQQRVEKRRKQKALNVLKQWTRQRYSNRSCPICVQSFTYQNRRFILRLVCGHTGVVHGICAICLACWFVRKIQETTDCYYRYTWSPDGQQTSWSASSLDIHLDRISSKNHFYNLLKNPLTGRPLLLPELRRLDEKIQQLGLQTCFPSFYLIGLKHFVYPIILRLLWFQFNQVQLGIFGSMAFLMPRGSSSHFFKLMTFTSSILSYCYPISSLSVLSGFLDYATQMQMLLGCIGKSVFKSPFFFNPFGQIQMRRNQDGLVDLMRIRAILNQLQQLFDELTIPFSDILDVLEGKKPHFQHHRSTSETKSDDDDDDVEELLRDHTERAQQRQQRQQQQPHVFRYPDGMNRMVIFDNGISIGTVIDPFFESSDLTMIPATTPLSSVTPELPGQFIESTWNQNIEELLRDHTERAQREQEQQPQARQRIGVSNIPPTPTTPSEEEAEEGEEDNKVDESDDDHELEITPSPLLALSRSHSSIPPSPQPQQLQEFERKQQQTRSDGVITPPGFEDFFHFVHSGSSNSPNDSAILVDVDASKEDEVPTIRLQQSQEQKENSATNRQLLCPRSIDSEYSQTLRRRTRQEEMDVTKEYGDMIRQCATFAQKLRNDDLFLEQSFLDKFHIRMSQQEFEVLVQELSKKLEDEREFTLINNLLRFHRL
jgi:hypothetical protein